jgi:hypothetical protein
MSTTPPCGHFYLRYEAFKDILLRLVTYHCHEKDRTHEVGSLDIQHLLSLKRVSVFRVYY